MFFLFFLNFVFDFGNENISENELIQNKAVKLTASTFNSAADIFSNDGKICFKGNEISLDTKKLPIKGTHNLGNIGVAYAVTSSLGIRDDDFISAVYSD